MKINLLIASTLASFSAFANVQPMDLQQAQQLLNQPIPENIQTVLDQTPTDYSFSNQQGESSVNYQGQVMRNVLINDNKAGFYSLKYAELTGDKQAATDKLDSYYVYEVEKDGGSFFSTQIADENGTVQPSPWEGFEYSAIFPREINLKSKMAGEDNALRNAELLGWNTPQLGGVVVDRNGDGTLMPTEFFEAMIEAVANNASGTEGGFVAPNGAMNGQPVDLAAILPNGVDLAQMSQKFLHVAVSFSQAAGDYLSDDIIPTPDTPINSLKGLYGDNSAPLANRTYTYLQHHWDEAFGYYGAARNYLDYTDMEIRSGVSIDAYTSDEVIDPTNGNILYISALNEPDLVYSLSSEKNMGLSVNAAKRDLGAQTGSEDFTQKTMTAFLKGRQLVQERPEGYMPYAQAHAVVALHEWERVIAATVVHYINETAADLKVYGTADYTFTNLAKHYSEMKGFAFAFQFNPRSVMSIADFKELHQLLGDRPVDPTSGDVDQYVQDLLAARDILQETYGFNPVDVENW